MTNREENKLNMFQSVRSLLEKFIQITADAPAIGRATERLKNLIVRIEEIHQKHKTIAKGKAAEKDYLEDEMMNDLVAFNYALYAGAGEQKDTVLQAQTKATESDFKKMRQSELLERAKSVLAQAETHKDMLIDNGIDQVRLDLFKNKLLKFETALKSLGATAAEKSAARQELDSAFEETDQLLTNTLDPLIEVFRSNQPEFYNQYYSARVIKDIGGGHQRRNDDNVQPPSA